MNTLENWFRKGEALVVANQCGMPGFTEGLELLKKFAAAGFIETQATLGHPMSQDRLADL